MSWIDFQIENFFGLEAHHLNLDKPSVIRRNINNLAKRKKQEKFLLCVADLPIDQYAGEIVIERKINYGEELLNIFFLSK